MTTLQVILIQQGLMTGAPTGYFGVITLKGVKAFQRAHNIVPTGLVGPLTRAVLSTMTSSESSSSVAEKFEGTVTAYSTACFADGECSITVDGKKIVTTIGWSQQIVGKVIGIPDFGSIENNLGARAKVYAKKTDAGYTLYGNANYYIEIIPASQGKLPAGSQVTNPSSVQGVNWVWQKALEGSSLTLPNKGDAFTVMLGSDGKITGTTDCNNFFSTATFGSDGFITFSPFGSTRMFCDGSQESVFINMLQKTSQYMIDANGNLILTLSDSKGVMHFVKK